MELFSLSIKTGERGSVTVTELADGTVCLSAYLKKDETYSSANMILSPGAFAAIGQIALKWIIDVKERKHKKQKPLKQD
jgi:hypothetical protein